MSNATRRCVNPAIVLVSLYVQQGNQPPDRQGTGKCQRPNPGNVNGKRGIEQPCAEGMVWGKASF